MEVSHGERAKQARVLQGDGAFAVLAWEDGGVGEERSDAGGVLSAEGIEPSGVWVVAPPVQEGAMGGRNRGEDVGGQG